jgi:hypothetical protein
MRTTSECTGKQTHLSRIHDVLDAEASAVEAAELAGDPNAPPPAGTAITRGHPRAKNLQVRVAVREGNSRGPQP